MAPIASVDHGTIDFLRQEFDSARRVMAHHEQIGAHGVERDRGVDQGLALLDGRGRDRHVHNVGAEALSRQLKRALRAGRGFKEKVYERAAAQIATLLVDPTALRRRFLGQVE